MLQPLVNKTKTKNVKIIEPKQHCLRDIVPYSFFFFFLLLLVFCLFVFTQTLRLNE